MADEENGTEAPEKKGGMMKIIVIVVGVVVLLGGGAFAGKMFFGSEEPAEGEELAEDAEPTQAPAIYQSMHPPLVVNFKSELGDSHFMQVTMEVMSRDQNVINTVRDHTPAIRNALIMLYANVVYEEVTTQQGKEKMLSDGLAEIQRVMTEQTGDEEMANIEALYFTSLVIQ